MPSKKIEMNVNLKVVTPSFMKKEKIKGHPAKWKVKRLSRALRQCGAPIMGGVKPIRVAPYPLSHITYIAKNCIPPNEKCIVNWPIPKPLPNHPMWNMDRCDYIPFMSVPIKTHAVARAHGRGVGAVQRLAVVSLVAAQNGSVGCYHIALQLHSHLQRLQRGVNVNYRHFQGVMQIPSGLSTSLWR